MKGKAGAPNAQPIECGEDGALSGKSCFFCKKPGNGFNQYPQNLNQDQRCTNCGKMCHGPKICWSKPKAKQDGINPSNHLAFVEDNNGDGSSSDNY